MKLLCSSFVAYCLLAALHSSKATGYCDISSKTCHGSNENTIQDEKFLFYDVNPPEGFNLRRDVYMRFAIMLAETRSLGKKLNWRLVLPPWHRLYHWRSEEFSHQPLFWSNFFDVSSLKSYSPVLEMHELFTRDSNNQGKPFEIDVVYVLQNYEDPFENGEFQEKWEISDEPCDYNGFWGYHNITAKEVLCVTYQGKISMLWELIALHPKSKRIMFAHGEIPLHDVYGTKPYWDCRRSMKFSKTLAGAAETFISNTLSCPTVKCSNYLSVHWRRQDFVYGRDSEAPSVAGTVSHIHKTVQKKIPQIKKIFIATDASEKEVKQLVKELRFLNYKTYFYLPKKTEQLNFKEGGVAIIDQIICSRASFFIGTHESTFTFRIQEEREILGFDSSTTFNRICPDKGPCEKSSVWKIVQ